MPGLTLGFTPVIRKLVYNGFSFNDSTHTERFSIRPVEDASGRTFTHAEFDITVTFVLNPGTQGPQVVENAVSQLTQPAAGLLLVGHGFKPLNINLGGPKDVRWGPKPYQCDVENLGAGNSVRIRWSCRWATLTCGDAVFAGLFPLEFCFTVKWDIDQSGLTRRSISGFVSVPATRANQNIRTLPITADQMREKINPPGLPGFRRVPGSFDIDYAKTKLSFNITDIQFESNIPPPGVIEASAEHTITQEAGKPYVWTGTLNAEYEIARGFTVRNALDSFFALLKDRWDQTRQNIVVIFKLPKARIIPWQFTVADSAIYGRQTVRLTAVYRIIGANLPRILGSAGLWRPVPGSNWKTWASSLALNLGPRGVAGLFMRIQDDVIADLCKPSAAVIELTGGGDITELRGGGGNAELRGGLRPPLGKPAKDAVLKGVIGAIGAVDLPNLVALFPPPTPAESYLDFVCGYRIETETGLVVASTLPGAPISTGAGTGVDDVLNNTLRGIRESSFFPPATDIGANVPRATTGGTFAQQRVMPKLYVFLFGHAQRLGFPVAIPELIQVLDQTPIPCNRTDKGEGFEQTVVGGDAVNNSLFVAKWNLRYLLTDPPSSAMPAIPNPLL